MPKSVYFCVLMNGHFRELPKSMYFFVLSNGREMPKSMHFYVLSSGRPFIQTVRSLGISSTLSVTEQQQKQDGAEWAHFIDCTFPT